MKKSIIISTDDFQKYLKDIRKIPVISHEEQNEIFTKLKDKTISKKEKKELYDRITIGNLRFVISVAKNYQNQGLDLVDLISEGNIGLITAIDKYDIETGYRFISYAVWWIRQSILESITENSRTIRIPTNRLVEDQRQINYNSIYDYDELFNDHDKLLDIDFKNPLPYCIDLNSKINDDGDELIDMIENPNTVPTDQPSDLLSESKKKIESILNVLEDREKKIIMDYYGFNGCEISLDDIGDSLGCTKERVRQIKVNAIKKLRNESYYLLKNM